MPRIETDSIGSRELPDDVLFGINTLRGAENFLISSATIGDDQALVRALAIIKKSAAQANGVLGGLTVKQTNAISAACDEIMGGKHHDQFIINMLEGSGGTSINMNANEVIANRALQIMGYEAGAYEYLKPNDHVNMGQSTNDVVPTAVKLAVLQKVPALTKALTRLGEAFQLKADELAEVLKIGRTCMQGAQPMTMGQEFSGYSAAILRARDKIMDTTEALQVLPLGATAIGTELGARAGYQEAVYRYLGQELPHPVQQSDNLFDAMQNSDGFSRLSAELRVTAEILGKISLDLIMMSSDKQSGIGEIKLPAIQPGSSIMPGKVNPVMPMMVQQLAFAVIGNDTAISLAALNGQLEINHFEPIIASRLFDSIDLLTHGADLFAKKCVNGIEALEDKALQNLLNSSALATVFVPILGYAEVSKIVKEADVNGKRFVDVIVEMGLMSREQIISKLSNAALWGSAKCSKEAISLI
ncbi:Aspartate ammonia-lyase [Pseudovibrio sp. Ad13]|uniref:aspartate ammonia-lyase n=1 Tax=unclassified Pseudovibrio TaxID=2627060 RepID=UPI0007B228A1|nr:MULTISPECIES: aspartate ammonia-lyase [unclassified Pseudovibrio]KZK78877.1 Aspartate ammonia-lyase [Pseudovibrio sp. Ad46]KZK84919.1 Aspartate ammonia-lyase [Pseudovibrio sp. Ad13]